MSKSEYFSQWLLGFSKAFVLRKSMYKGNYAWSLTGVSICVIRVISKIFCIHPFAKFLAFKLLQKFIIIIGECIRQKIFLFFCWYRKIRMPILNAYIERRETQRLVRPSLIYVIHLKIFLRVFKLNFQE